MPQRAYLVLQNGTVFEGFSFGAVGEVTGETVFTTGMTGYLETLTDRSYYGQIVTQTFPLIGNYGVIPEDFESAAPVVKGYIVKHWCQDPSNFRSEGDLDAFLKASGIIGLYGIDTRKLTKIIREHGVMNGRITTARPDGVPQGILDYEIRDAVKNCSTREIYRLNEGKRYRVAVIDYGLRKSILNSLCRRDIEVVVYPHDTPAERILSDRPDGIALTNGPGDPRAAENKFMVNELKKLCGSGVRIFGICFGNQMLALAHGFEIEKLKYGHRGANQPARDTRKNRVYITSQNHGYAVVGSGIDRSIADEWFVNVNDGTNEGIIYKNAPIYSVQFHPEASAGPSDTSWLYDRFAADMEVRKHAAR